MRLWSLLLVSFLTSLGGAAAGETQKTQPTKVPSPAVARTVHVIAGEITSIDVPASLVAVRESVPTASQKGQKPVKRTVVLVVTAETLLLRGKEPAPISDLKPGDYVVSRYAETPQGALALSLRAADVVARTTPTGTPAPGEAPVRESGQR